jgi:hypothetical protein
MAEIQPKKKGSKQEVYDGHALCTPGGLKKEDLILNAKNQVVSKKRSEQGKKQIEHLQGKKNLKIEPIDKIEAIPEEEKKLEEIVNLPLKNENLNIAQSKLNEIDKTTLDKNFLPERYNDLAALQEEAKQAIAESKNKRTRKTKNEKKIKNENPVIDEILHGEKFEEQKI